MATTATTWGSRIGFILAGAGSAIGLGSIWKFPFWAGINGGSGFIIPYILFTFTIGITLLIAELVVGRAGRGSAFNALKKLGGPAFTVMGGIAVLTSFVILSYYSVVGGWCVKYLVDSIIGNAVTSDPKALQATFGNLVSDGIANSLWHMSFLTLTCGVVAAGVVNGIERLSKYLLPTLFILMIVIMVRSLSLPGAMEGVKFLFDFSFDKLTWMGVLNAMGFTFFSLSLGCGIKLHKRQSLQCIGNGRTIYFANHPFSIQVVQAYGSFILTLKNNDRTLGGAQSHVLIIYLLVTVHLFQCSQYVLLQCHVGASHACRAQRAQVYLSRFAV